MENEVEEKESRMGVYEVGYIMVPTIAEENLGAEVGDFKDSLTKMGAVFISDEHPKMFELAYEMSRSIENKRQKFSYGYFGWVKFECSTVEAKAIKDMLDKNEKLVRYLLIKTVRESTMSSKRSYGRPDGVRKKVTPKTEEVVEQIDETVIDKEIDALVLE
jgi:ribosomal protein S6